MYNQLFNCMFTHFLAHTFMLKGLNNIFLQNNPPTSVGPVTSVMAWSHKNTVISKHKHNLVHWRLLVDSRVNENLNPRSCRRNRDRKWNAKFVTSVSKLIETDQVRQSAGSIFWPFVYLLGERGRTFSGSIGGNVEKQQNIQIAVHRYGACC